MPNSNTRPGTAARAEEIVERLRQLERILSDGAREAKNIGALSDSDMRFEDVSTMRHVVGSLEVTRRLLCSEMYRWALAASARDSYESGEVS